MKIQSVIWKHVLDFMHVGGEVTVNLPRGCDILDLQIQEGGIRTVNRAGLNQIVLWTIHPVAETVRVSRTFRLFPTGVPFEHGYLRHTGTVQDNGLVWHIFEEIQ